MKITATVLFLREAVMSSISNVGSSILTAMSSGNSSAASKSAASTSSSSTNTTTAMLQSDLELLEQQLEAEQASKTDSAKVQQQK